MIDREKIIKALECCDDSGSGENLRCEDCPYKAVDEGTCPAINTLHADVLKLLKEQEPIGWISVKDRLPERYERILTYDKYSGVKENWLLKSTPCVSWSYGFHVTHWMPMPEPPKEVNNG